MDDTIRGLAHTSDDIFYKALGTITPAQKSSSFLEQLCVALGESALPEMRQAERLRATLNKLAIQPTELRPLLIGVTNLSPALRNTFASFMPPSERRRFTAATAAPAPPDPIVTAPHGAGDGEQDRTPLEVTSLASEAPACSSIVILSAAAQQDANRKLLLSNRFSPFVYDTVEALAADLHESSDICGCVIDRSFLQPLTTDQQRDLFTLIAGYSTFIIVRVDEAGLKISADAVQEILRAVRLHNRPVAARELSLQESGTLRQSELTHFDRAARVLRSFQNAAFIPGELREDERRLLIAAAYEHANELQLRGEIRIEALETRFLGGGFSGAQVALVRVNSDSRAVVAKIGAKQPIRDELERFRTYIQVVDDQLKPFACFHGNCGAILFAFVQDEEDDGRPAKMLDERLQAFWFDEVSGIDVAVAYTNLCRGLHHAAATLARLNRLRPSATALAGLGNPDVVMKYLERLERAGIDLGLEIALQEARSCAAKKFATLANAAVSHGDVHLRNILIRGDRSAHLVDFAGSGPGHPAVDLVRLEVALFTEFFRPIRSEDDYVKLQRRLSVDAASFDELRAEFDLDRGPMINKLCIHGCIAARDKVLAVLGEHGGSQLDYLAAKCLVAWQTLLMHGRQAVLTRSIIRAVSGSFLSPTQPV